LTEERTRLLKQTLPTLPIQPIDLFSRGTDMYYGKFHNTNVDTYIHNYPEILDLKVNAKSGVYDVVGLSNWRPGTASKTLSFADKLGLDSHSRYLVFDFWGQKLLGVFQNSMKVDVDRHDTRVFLIHPLLNRPQLIGTSRHITGAYSIKDLAWDNSKNWLRGTSETVPGDDYALWFSIPLGFTVAGVHATSQDKSEIHTRQEVSGNAFKVSFPGQREYVDWRVEFGGKSGK